MHGFKALSIHARIDHNFMVASIPTYRVAVHARRLVAAGHKVICMVLCQNIHVYSLCSCEQVGIVRQTETEALRRASKKSVSKTFDRAVTAVFSPGTPICDDDPSFLGLLARPPQSTDEDEADADLGDHTEVAESADSGATTIVDERWIVCVYEGELNKPVGSGSGNRCGCVAVDVTAAQARYSEVSVDDSFIAVRQFMDMFPVRLSSLAKNVIRC
jgi:hypothetical protein